MESAKRLSRFGVLALLCLTAVSCSGSADNKPTSGASAEPTATAKPSARGDLFSGAQPWTTDVSGARSPPQRCDHSVALRPGGWGNGNAFQTDFSIPVFFADAAHRGCKSSAPTNTASTAPTATRCRRRCRSRRTPPSKARPTSRAISRATPRPRVTAICSSSKRCREALRGLPGQLRRAMIITAVGFFVWDLTKIVPGRPSAASSAPVPTPPVSRSPRSPPTADEVASGESITRCASSCRTTG